MSGTFLKLEGKAWSTLLDAELAPQTKQLYSRWIQIFIEYYKIKNPDRLLKLEAVRQIEDWLFPRWGQ
jgi:hypothetical protein